LPENVRAAIDSAKSKNSKSEFYYKLRDLKKNIKKYRSLFHSKKPTHHTMFLKKKKVEMEKKLELEKQKMKIEVHSIEQKIQSIHRIKQSKSASKLTEKKELV